VLGRFLEFSVRTPDIRASVEFYERLGFEQAQTRDVWSHPYGVLTDGRIALGLHEHPAREISLTFVHPDVAERCAELERQGLELAYRHTGAEAFHEIGLDDPSGQRITIIEARTYSPAPRAPAATSLCGYFAELSLPATDFEAARLFWESLGFVATGELEKPYPRLTLTSDHLNLAFHAPRMLATPALVFASEDMAARIAQLRDLGVESKRKLPAQLNRPGNALFEAPEGTLLLLLSEET
jgi:catechol 2,3-dioxygenase-like lactoylglutathione lyase family enzyme